MHETATVLALGAIGYVPNAEQTESVKQGINIIVNLAPAIAVVLSAIPLLWYDINGKAKMDEIYAALEARNAAQKDINK